ncbi:MAG: peptidylprolyl isomerase [Patescibacteria group bacterium]|jgi:parvulin-like peptidyl-prolyl isomerase
MEITPLNEYSPSPVTPPLKSTNKKFRLLIGLSFGALLLVVLAAVSTAVYFLPANDMLVRSVTAVVPYPVALVNLQPISFKDFYKEYDALETFYEANQTPEEEQLPATERASNVLDSMIDHIVVSQLAKQYSVELDPVKVEENLQAAFTQSGSEEAFYTEIERVFNWTRQDFLTHALEPLVLADQVEEKVLSDATLQTETTDKINQALTRIKNNEDFATVAGEVSEDTTAASGGDLGHLTVAEMPEEWTNFVTTAELNVISEVIDVGQVYTLVMVTEKVESEEETQYNIKAIVVYKRGLAEVMDSFLESSKIWKLMQV